MSEEELAIKSREAMRAITEIAESTAAFNDRIAELLSVKGDLRDVIDDLQHQRLAAQEQEAIELRRRLAEIREERGVLAE